MRRIISAIKSGFEDKVINILPQVDGFITIREANRIRSLSIDFNMPSVFVWLTTNSIHRWDFEKIDYDTKFIVACKSGHYEILKMLIDMVCPSTLNRALKKSSKNGNSNIVKILLSDRRTNPSVQQNLPLRTACKKGRIEIVKLLLNDKRIQPSTSDYITDPLELAIMFNHPEIVKILLQNKKMSTAYWHDNLIVRACDIGLSEITKILLADDRIDPTMMNNQPIRHACFLGRANIVRILLSDERIDPAAIKNFALLQAISNNDIEITKILLGDPRINPGDNDDTALIEACSRGYFEIVRLLISDKRVNPFARNNDAIKIANMAANKEIKDLLENIGCKCY